MLVKLHINSSHLIGLCPPIPLRKQPGVKQVQQHLSSNTSLETAQLLLIYLNKSNNICPPIPLWKQLIYCYYISTSPTTFVLQYLSGNSSVTQLLLLYVNKSNNICPPIPLWKQLSYCYYISTSPTTFVLQYLSGNSSVAQLLLLYMSTSPTTFVLLYLSGNSSVSVIIYISKQVQKHLSSSTSLETAQLLNYCYYMSTSPTTFGLQYLTGNDSVLNKSNTVYPPVPLWKQLSYH